MNSAAGCAAVIPCLNEAAAIESLVRAVRKHLSTVLVVDDGSRDDTASLARKAGADVLRHSQPQGKAAALLAGWQWARARGFRWTLSLDGDGQHAPEDILAFLEHVGRGADLIIGNRMDEADAMPWIRRLANRWMSQRISMLAGQPLPDSQCGFRLMNLEAWAQLEISAAHFQIESEVLLAFVRAGFGIDFVPVHAIYKDEQSKISPARDTVRWIRWWLRARRAAKSDRTVPETVRTQAPGFLASKTVRAPK